MLYILIFVVGFVAVSLWSFFIAIHPPKLQPYRTPADFDLPAENVVLTTEDDIDLSAWFIPSESNTRQAIILLHGYPSEKSDMLSIASKLYPDFSLFLLDLRYFGESGGNFSTLGIKEQLDTKAALDFLESKGYEQIGIFGFSLGGATALMTAADDSRIDAIVSYASFSNLKTLGTETYASLFILKYPLIELMNVWVRLFLGAWVTDISPENAAQNISIPVLLIHTQKDEQITFSHAKRLQNALDKNEKALFYFPEMGLHGELPLDFDDRVKDFFKKAL